MNTNDVIGALSLLEGVNQLDRKSIVARRNNGITPLFHAAIRGNVDMVECLVKEWQVDVEEFGEPRKHMLTPLCGAALSNNLEVVKLLIDLGADVNAASNSGGTPVLYACTKMNVDIVKCLIKHGANIQKSNKCGETCLIVAAQRKCEELCKIFIDNGAEMNAQLTSNGNTALHCAISGDNNPDTPNIVQLLIDHGADPCITNTRGDDVFRAASLQHNESILRKLLFASKPPLRRWIESYRLLGSSYLMNGENQNALSSWKMAVNIQSCFCVDVPASQPNPVYLSVQEVNTVEELETLSQNFDLFCMHALVIREQILGPHHAVTQ